MCRMDMDSSDMLNEARTLILLLFFVAPFDWRQHIDQIMSSHGKQIMQAVTLILEAERSIEVKEQVRPGGVCGAGRTLEF